MFNNSRKQRNQQILAAAGTAIASGIMAYVGSYFGSRRAVTDVAAEAVEAAKAALPEMKEVVKSAMAFDAEVAKTTAMQQELVDTTAEKLAKAEAAVKQLLQEKAEAEAKAKADAEAKPKKEEKSSKDSKESKPAEAKEAKAEAKEAKAEAKEAKVEQKAEKEA